MNSKYSATRKQCCWAAVNNKAVEHLWCLFRLWFRKCATKYAYQAAVLPFVLILFNTRAITPPSQMPNVVIFSPSHCNLNYFTFPYSNCTLFNSLNGWIWLWFAICIARNTVRRLMFDFYCDCPMCWWKCSVRANKYPFEDFFVRSPFEMESQCVLRSCLTSSNVVQNSYRSFMKKKLWHGDSSSAFSLNIQILMFNKTIFIRVSTHSMLHKWLCIYHKTVFIAISLKWRINFILIYIFLHHHLSWCWCCCCWWWWCFSYFTHIYWIKSL